MRRALRVVLLLFLVMVVSVVLAVGALWPLTPSVGDAEERVDALAAAHGTADVAALPSPDRIGQAVVATENSRFFHDWGIDPLGVVRSAEALPPGGVDRGGSTLEQQLAKNLYPSRPGAMTEAAQAELAFKLDRRWGKDEVLRMYLSAVYFGHGYYGVASASRGYFGTEPDQLTWAQASLLAGLVQAPTAYDPVEHPALAKLRQRHVLDRLVATRTLTRAEASAALAASWGLRAT